MKLFKTKSLRIYTYFYTSTKGFTSLRLLKSNYKNERYLQYTPMVFDSICHNVIGNCNRSVGCRKMVGTELRTKAISLISTIS